MNHRLNERLRHYLHLSSLQELFSLYYSYEDTRKPQYRRVVQCRPCKSHSTDQGREGERVLYFLNGSKGQDNITLTRVIPKRQSERPSNSFKRNTSLKGITNYITRKQYFKKTKNKTKKSFLDLISPSFSPFFSFLFPLFLSLSSMPLSHRCVYRYFFV